MFQQGIRSVAAHIAGWVLYLLILVLGAQSTDQSFWFNTIATIIPLIILFYLNVSLIFPQLLVTRKYFLLVIALALVDLLCVALRLLLADQFFSPPANAFVDRFFSAVPFWNQFRVNLLFIGISFAYWYAQNNYRIKKNQEALEKEVLAARLSSLKHQINPHFLYNTLSFIYTKSLSHSTELAGSIARLSDLMRYSLSEADPDGKACLEKEVSHIRNFIDIQQMRFDNNLHVLFETSGDIRQFRIMPLLLITFVENAFKHGQLNDRNSPVDIRLNVDHKALHFYIRNKKIFGEKDPAHGIGLNNVCSRLQLAYPQQHELNISDTVDEFFVDLKINRQ
jgi:two-component system, LytTR family, sensor kinase